MPTTFERFKCDHCGACCQTLIVEADYLDCMREPRLFQLTDDKRQFDRSDIESGERCVVLYDVKTKQCPFLRPITELSLWHALGFKETDTHCSIYNTRPNACVLVEAGDAKCQQARGMKGLPLLVDEDGKPPTRAMLEESCEKYGLEFDDVFSIEVI